MTLPRRLVNAQSAAVRAVSRRAFKRDGLHARMKRRREFIADRAKNGFVRLCVMVELVRRNEKIIELGYRHAGKGQPVAAMCR